MEGDPKIPSPALPKDPLPSPPYPKPHPNPLPALVLQANAKAWAGFSSSHLRQLGHGKPPGPSPRNLKCPCPSSLKLPLSLKPHWVPHPSKKAWLGAQGGHVFQVRSITCSRFLCAGPVRSTSPKPPRRPNSPPLQCWHNETKSWEQNKCSVRLTAKQMFTIQMKKRKAAGTPPTPPMTHLQWSLAFCCCFCFVDVEFFFSLTHLKCVSDYGSFLSLFVLWNHWGACGKAAGVTFSSTASSSLWPFPVPT